MHLPPHIQQVLQCRVERGVGALDEASPGWEHYVRTDVLQMDSSRRCIVGQVFGEYDLTFLGLSTLNRGIEYGFDVAHTTNPLLRSAQLDYLHDSWVALISERIASGVTSMDLADLHGGVTFSPSLCEV